MRNLPGGWGFPMLSELGAEARESVRPQPGRKYEVWSVPSFANKNPELLDGAAIGSAKRAVHADDVLICKINPRINRVWLVDDHCKDDLARVASPEWLIFRVADNERVEPRYLRHYLTSPRFRDWIVTAVSGVTGSHTRAKSATILRQRIPVPPIEEQRRIVDILEDRLSRLDAGNALLGAAAKRAERLLQRATESILTGTERGTAPASLSPAGVDDGHLPELAHGWIWRRLGELADVVGGVTKDASKQGDPSFVHVPYLRVANVQRGRLDLSTVTTIGVPPTKAEALRLQAGDVLLNEGGDRDKLGRGWVWEDQIPGCIHQNHVFRARIRDDLIDPRLLSWAANTIGGRWCERNGKQSVNLASISLSRIRLMPVPVPPAAEQPRIVKQVEEVLAALARLNGTLDESAARSAGLRRGLLGAAFSGELTGHSSDLDRVEESIA